MEVGNMPEIDTIKAMIRPLAIEYGLKRIYLFGSFAKGTANEDSDIDLLIEKGKPMSLLKLSGFRQDVEEKMKRSVDVVTTKQEFIDLQTTVDGIRNNIRIRLKPYRSDSSKR